jgi:endonuclease V-like protein UPF0215 family
VIGIDDGPFAREHRGDVPMVGVAFSGVTLEGVLVGRVRRDGQNATRAIVTLVAGSRFARHTQVVLLQGIALAGFNVVDIHELSARLGIGVLVVARRAPDMAAIESALRTRVPGGARKWRLFVRRGRWSAWGPCWCSGRTWGWTKRRY